MKDGAALMYVKDGTLYPVALSEDEMRLLQYVVAASFNPLKVVFSQPQGKVVNVLDEKEEKLS